MFSDSKTWFEHELEVHRLEWRCVFCTNTPYRSLEKLESHMRSQHAQNYIEEQLPIVAKASQRSLDRIPASSCPMCSDWEQTLKEVNLHLPPNETLVVTPTQFRQHVGSHMEQLALFAIPRGYEDENDADSNSAAADTNTNEYVNNDSRVDSDNQDEVTDDPPLHIAAFEGRGTNVLSMIDDGADINSSGMTWGSAIRAAAAGIHHKIVGDLLLRGASDVEDDISVDMLRTAPNVDTVAQTVSGGGQKINYLGQEYDNVFDVEIESGKAPLKLPYNVSQPPMDAATMFVDNNGLPKTYLEQIVNFIVTNRQPPSSAKQKFDQYPRLNLVSSVLPGAFQKEYQSLMSLLQARVDIDTPTSYNNASVLLLFWDGATEDPGFKDEFDALCQTFTETYGYFVHRARLKVDLKKLPQVQVKRFVRDFVFENDGSETLLIIYFMGHSDAGQLSGSQRPLMYVYNGVYKDSWSADLDSNMSHVERQRKLNQMIQNTVDHIMLKDTQADTLEIFDWYVSLQDVRN